jgi:Tol biopolymer transport system component
VAAYIKTINADGTGETTIYTDPGRGGCVSWSSTNVLIFDNEINPNSVSSDEIWSIRPDGSGLSRLTNNSTCDNRPSVSPDGTKILFCRAHGAGGIGTDRLHTMNIDGSGESQVMIPVSNDLYRNEWSPDGTKIVFEMSMGGGNYDIAIANIDGSNVTRLTDSATDECLPDWGVARE